MSWVKQKRYASAYCLRRLAGLPITSAPKPRVQSLVCEATVLLAGITALSLLVTPFLMQACKHILAEGAVDTLGSLPSVSHPVRRPPPACMPIACSNTGFDQAMPERPLLI